jgi:ligand-binding sensor domain-containing protein
MMRRLVSALALVGLAQPASAQSPSRDWRPADRTVIGDFTRITSVASALDRVYVTSPTSLLIWHPQLQQWEGPFDPPDAGLLTRVFASLVDPLDNSLWLARPDGWVHFQPELQIWDRGLASGVVAIAFDGADPVAGLYLRTRSEWLLVPHGGLAAAPSRAPSRPVTPARVDDVLRSSPTLQANAAQILVDPRLGTARYTAAARGFENQGWYLGTSGVGLLYLQDGAALPDRLSFGLPSPVVGAVFDAADGVWAATDRTAQADAALTFVDPELKQFRSLRGPPATGIPFTQSRDLVGQQKSLWVATDFGLARVAMADGRIDLVDAARGLPDSRVYAVVSRQGRITVGTARGVARVDDSLRVDRVAPLFGETARAVFPAGDSVWVGTSRGVLLALPGARDLVRPAALATASLQAPVVAFASLADTVVALTRDQLLWRDPRTGGWTLAPNLSGLLGGLRSFTADGAGFWVAGEHGVGFARLGTAAIVTLREGDLPGTSNDIAVDREYLWVATDGGLVRFRLTAIRP